MDGNKSSASQENITPAGKPSKSFISETGKSGALGADGINVNAMAEASNDTSKSRISEEFASNPGLPEVDGMTQKTPQGKPSSSFINTSAVK